MSVLCLDLRGTQAVEVDILRRLALEETSDRSVAGNTKRNMTLNSPEELKN